MSQRGIVKEKTTSTTEPVDKAVNTFNLMSALLDDQYKELRKIREVEERKIPDGRTFPMVITLANASNRYVYIDFLDDSDTKNIPAGAFANPPYVKLRRLLIYNDGPADINAATNDTPSMSMQRGGTIKANSSLDINFEFAVIESLSLALATAADAVVRIIGFT